MKRKWVELSNRCGLVCCVGISVECGAVNGGRFEPVLRAVTGKVSGRYLYRNAVSATIKSKEKPAAVENGFAATVSTFAKVAPSIGPSVNAIEKQAPTSAIVAPLCFSSLISVAIAVASWTLPSLNPPTILLARNVRKSAAATHRATDTMLPAMDQRRVVRRPCLSDSVPITGDAMA